MNQSILIDTSVLIALLSRSDRYHEWALSTVSQLQKPFLTCEAVITETCFLLKRNTQSHQQVFAFLEREALVNSFCSESRVSRYFSFDGAIQVGSYVSCGCLFGEDGRVFSGESSVNLR